MSSSYSYLRNPTGPHKHTARIDFFSNDDFSGDSSKNIRLVCTQSIFILIDDLILTVYMFRDLFQLGANMCRDTLHSSQLFYYSEISRI